MSAQQTLIEMGFPANKIEHAIKACGENAEQAMEWLLAHADEPCSSNLPIIISEGNAQEIKDGNIEMKDGNSEIKDGKIEMKDGKTEIKDGNIEMKDGNIEMKEVLETDENNELLENSAKPDENAEVNDSSNMAKSFKCDDCQKLFKTKEEVEFHAHKSGHSSFSESTEEKKPMTEEEKKQKLKDLEDKMKLRRKQKEEEDRREAIEREKKRIQLSKDITETKRQMAEKEMKLIAEQRRKEKLEDKLARQKVRDQIERDKVARKEMFGGGAVTPSAVTSHCPPVNSTPQQPIQKKEYEYTRLQIRLPFGPPLVQEFKVKESLSAVRLWIRLNRKDRPTDVDSFTLSTTFPRKTFGDEDMDKPLNILQLVPSAVLVVNDC